MFFVGAVFTLLVGLGLELIVRASGPLPAEPYPMAIAPAADPLFTYDAALHWRPRPHAGGVVGCPETNSLGLRDTEFPAPTPLPMFSILVLGDSPTWGDGVPSRTTYSAVLEMVLDPRYPDQSIQVLNAGIPAYTTVQSLKLEAELLDRFDFDLVTIANMGSDAFLADRPDAAYELGPVRLALARGLARCCLFRWVRERVRPEYGARPTYSRDMVHRVPAEPDYRENLQAMVELARQHGAQAMMLQPFRLVLDGSVPVQGGSMPADQFAAMSAHVQLAEPDYRDAMAVAARETGVPLVDLAAIAREAASPSPLYVDQIHPSERGHELIAYTLAEPIGEVIDDWVAPLLAQRRH